MRISLLAFLSFLFVQYSSAQLIIVGDVDQSNITTTSFDLSYPTFPSGTAVTTILHYGETEALELGYFSNGASTNTHNITLSGLTAGTIYYVKAGAIKNGTDTTWSTETKLFATQSNSSGSIKVYFNGSIDTDVSNGTYPDINNSGAAILSELINRIDNAQTTIDIAAYNINVSSIVTALTAAHNRGVQVRYIANIGTANTALSPAPPFPVLSINNDFLMHNKFLAIDASSVNDSYVWTGSMNLTSNNIYDDYNNVILIQDQSLAKAYVLEFNEMWGSTGANFDAQNSRAGAQKLDNTPHKFMIGSTLVESYFSPSDDVTNKIESAILSAGGDLSFALLTLTNNELGNAIINRHQSGEAVAGIINNIGDQGTEYNTLLSASVNVLADNHPDDIHHKYAIVDANTPNSDPMVITGSHNWSAAAEENNDENTLIIHNADIANWFLQEFSKRYCEITATPNCQYSPAVGTWTAPEAQISTRIFPNPAHQSARLEINAKEQSPTIRLTLTNALGQNLQEQVIAVNPGLNYTELSTADLPEGLYFIKLEAAGLQQIETLNVVH